ncbi:hypothetical protein M433DRAFT_330526 [Acidomyces richmondensis BFW]|nr:MAG: hypothetical protein FE78DRAFT_471560 [Acidomyces sp. 'richmondensis']KYG43856.1 hypothetical protein M433DRAFT_330526 [Acidomyces richmondensis BFW]
MEARLLALLTSVRQSAMLLPGRPFSCTAAHLKQRCAVCSSFLFLLFPFLSFPALSCPVLSCPVLSCPVLSCPVLSCPFLSFLLILRCFPTLRVQDRGNWTCREKHGGSSWRASKFAKNC